MKSPAGFRRSSAAPRSRAVRRALARKRRRARRGVAFVMVLGALTILTVMLTEVQDQSSADLSSALEARDALVAEYAARSAINLTRLLIAAEPTIRKSLGIFQTMLPPQIPVWNYSDRLLGAFNDPEGTKSFSEFAGLDLTGAKNLGLSGAAFEITVVEEDSKINLNAANNAFASQTLIAQLIALMAPPQYAPLFERRDPDGNFSDRQAICAALVDWVDSDASSALCDPTKAGQAQEMPAEDSYYELLKKPYHRKNAPFDSLEELRRVRGIGDDFWATFVDPQPEKPEKRMVTVWGQSNSINVNTADPLVLLAVTCANCVQPVPRFCSDPEETKKVISLLMMLKAFSFGLPPFKSPQMFVSIVTGRNQSMTQMMQGMAGMMGGGAGAMEWAHLISESEFLKQLRVKSEIFSIYATGIVKSARREVRTRLHEVVDFRGAPEPPATDMGILGLTMGMNDTTGTGTGGSGGTVSTAGSGGTGQGGSSGQGADLNRPNPAGNVIYFRME